MPFRFKEKYKCPYCGTKKWNGNGIGIGFEPKRIPNFIKKPELNNSYLRRRGGRYEGLILLNYYLGKGRNTADTN